MLGLKIALVASVLIASASMHSAHGDADIHLWIPENIIAGETYEAIILSERATWAGRTVVLSTGDPSIVQIPQSITILPYSNHGIFQVKPLREGSTEIFALVDGAIVSADVFIHSSSMKPEGLLLVLPANATKTDDVTGYVLTVDARGYPAPVPRDTVVRLSSTPLIEVEPSRIEIKEDHYYGKFYAKVRGTGKIYASAENLSVAESQIARVQDAVTVRVAVAPNIMMENSKAFFFVWLEKDGKPYKVPHVTYAFVSSSNLKSVQFNEGPLIKQHWDHILKIPLVDGVGRGHLVSQERGISSVTANVEGFGSAQADVMVGPVIVDRNLQFLEYGEGDKTRQIDARKPNIAVIWVYPATTDSLAHGVIALYNANYTQSSETSVTSDGVEVSSSNSINWLVPVPIDGRTVTLSSSSGLRHPSVLALSESNEILQSRGIGSTHAVQFEILGTGQGDHAIFVSGPGLEQYKSSLNVAPPFKEAYKIKPTRIPSILGTGGDLMMVSIVDDSGALVSTQRTFQDRVRFVVSSGAGHEETYAYINSAVHSGVLDGPTKVTIHADGLAPVEERLYPSGIASSVALDIPPRVHALEPFPYAIHEVDANGIPIRKMGSASISTTPGVIISEGRMQTDVIGTQNVGVVTNAGADSKNTEAFVNTFKIDIVTSGTASRVERQFQIELVSDIDGFETAVDSPFPYKRMDEKTFLVTPDKTGLHDIVFVASRDGYAPSRAVLSTVTERFVNLTVRAVASDGNELNIGHTIRIGNTSRDIITPFFGESRPDLLQASFPPDFVAGTRGYRLNNIMFDGQVTPESSIRNLFLGKDVEIVASYDRMVRVMAENAEGSGFYPYGNQVTLSVPPKDKVWILVRHVFDHWEGIEHASDRVVFEATEDVRARAVLREDYGVLMIIVASAVSLFLYVKYVRRRGLDVRFYLRSGWLRLSKFKKPGGSKHLTKKGRQDSNFDF